MIHVMVENIITKNGKGYKILAFSLLQKKELPDAYINGKQNGAVAYALCGTMIVWSVGNRDSAKVYGVGQIIQEDEKEFLFRELRSAGKHLSRVMKPIHELEKSGWVGKIWEVII